MRILFVGPVGSGKSTQARLLADHLGIPLIDTGSILRKKAQEKDQGGEIIKEAIRKGVLVDDDIAARVIYERINELDTSKGFVMDGYPRSLEQLKFFDPEFDKVIYLDLPDDLVKERLRKRGREDDTKEVIETRLKSYHQHTYPILKHYRDLGILTEIDASQTIDQIKEGINGSL